MGSHSEGPSKIEEMRERIEQSVGRVEERIGSKRGDDFAAIHGRVRRRRAEERLRPDEAETPNDQVDEGASDGTGADH